MSACAQVATGGAHFTEGSHVTYDRPNTIQHWQLRDLVKAAPGSEHEVYCVCSSRTIHYDTLTGQSTTVQALGFEPTSMTVGHGFIAAGGAVSQLDVRRLSGGRASVYKGTVGGSVNNALHIAKNTEGAPCLFVCNNDETIKVFALPSMAPLTSICCSTAINYCAVSPDGRMLACVGDSGRAYLYQASSSGYERIGCYSDATDAGMCCAWSPGGGVLAAASQDGLICLWDPHSSKVIAKLKADQACRNVKFTRGAVDLLAFSEHRGVVQLVDTRMYSSRQSLLLAPPDMSYHLSGLSFTSTGKRLFVGLEEGGIAAVDIDTLARRSFACGQLN